MKFQEFRKLSKDGKQATEGMLLSPSPYGAMGVDNGLSWCITGSLQTIEMMKPEDLAKLSGSDIVHQLQGGRTMYCCNNLEEGRTSMLLPNGLFRLTFSDVVEVPLEDYRQAMQPLTVEDLKSNTNVSDTKLRITDRCIMEMPFQVCFYAKAESGEIALIFKVPRTSCVFRSKGRTFRVEGFTYNMPPLLFSVRLIAGTLVPIAITVDMIVQDSLSLFNTKLASLPMPNVFGRNDGLSNFCQGSTRLAMTPESCDRPSIGDVCRRVVDLFIGSEWNDDLPARCIPDNIEAVFVAHFQQLKDKYGPLPPQQLATLSANHNKFTKWLMLMSLAQDVNSELNYSHYKRISRDKLEGLQYLQNIYGVTERC